MSETRLAVDGAMAVLSLDRPDKLNAMSEAMGAEIRGHVARLNADAAVRCVVVRGEGRAFSAGGDLDFLETNARRKPAENEATMRAFYGAFLALGELEAPSVALLQGRATGAGLCLALACDMRYAAEDAQLSVNFTRLGLTPGMGGTFNLPRLVGAARASELFFTGRVVSGTEAAAIGLVNGAFPAGELDAAGLEVARRIAEAAPGALRATKRLVREAASVDLPAALDAEAAAQAVCFASEDLAEGLASIRARRKAEFTGR